MQEVTIGMREKGINNLEWVDGKEWRKKIKTSGTERCTNIKVLCIKKYYYCFVSHGNCKIVS